MLIADAAEGTRKPEMIRPPMLDRPIGAFRVAGSVNLGSGRLGWFFDACQPEVVRAKELRPDVILIIEALFLLDFFSRARSADYQNF